jgi:iron(III) transport system substrate-binding protein
MTTMLTTHTKRPFRALVAAGALVAAVGASSLPIASASASVKHPHSVPTLLLYNAQGYGDSVAAAFNKTTSAFQVVPYDDSTGPLFTKIQAEDATGHPSWGMFWADGATEFAALDSQHALVTGITAANAPYNAAGKANLPANKSFAPTGLTVTGAFCYDKMAWGSAPFPTTMEGLTALSGSNDLGMNNPSVSGPTYPLIAGVMAHLGGLVATKHYTTAQINAAIAKGETFYKTLKNNGLSIHNTNGPTLGALEANPAQLRAATIQSSACYGDIAAGYWPTGGVKYLDYSVALPSNIAVNKKLSPALQADAKKFVAYVLSKTGQQAMQAGDPQGDGLFWPVINGVSPESGLPAYSATKAYSIDPYVWGPSETSINTWFTNNIIN